MGTQYISGERIMKKFIGFCLLFILSVAVVFPGCSGEDNDNNGTGPETFLPSGDIGSAGGTLQITDVATLIIPPDALSSTVTVSVTQGNCSVDPFGTNIYVSPCITISPVGLVLDEIATLTIAYDENLLQGADEEDIEGYSLDVSEWDLSSTVVHSTTNQIAIPISEFGVFSAQVDSTTPVQTDGIFCGLVIGRMIGVYSGAKLVMDQIDAIFDSTYAPCVPVKPVSPDSVSCDQYELLWDSNVDKFVHFFPYGVEAITEGDMYAFHVSGGVPTLNDSIAFPECSPYITSPETNGTASLSGFDVIWIDYDCGGMVRMLLMSGDDTTSVNFETENDGSYSFTGGQLTGLGSGVYSLIMIHQNSKTITASGYDSRSFIWGRVINTIIFELQ